MMNRHIKNARQSSLAFAAAGAGHMLQSWGLKSQAAGSAACACSSRVFKQNARRLA